MEINALSFSDKNILVAIFGDLEAGCTSVGCNLVFKGWRSIVCRNMTLDSVIWIMLQLMLIACLIQMEPKLVQFIHKLEAILAVWYNFTFQNHKLTFSEDVLII